MAGLVKFVAALALICNLFSEINCNIEAEYDHSAFLDPDEIFKLYWSVDKGRKFISLAVEVKTTGWVGFGISKGLTGSMKGADIVIGWVDKDGKGHLSDRHAKSNSMPLVDAKQDYELVGASENGGKTILKFKRKLVTCDKNDLDIPLGTAKVIYAYGNSDTVGYHQSRRGARSLNLLNYVKNVPPPAGAKYFDVMIKNVTVPNMRTTYWCEAFRLSDIVKLSGTRHIIEIAPLVAKKDRGVVHHMVLYACQDDFEQDHLNVTGQCYHPNMPRSTRECVGAASVFAWAVGGVNFKFPGHVGWPIGAPYSMKYVVLETHFDNPTLGSNFVVSTGLRFYYGSPRKYEADTLTTGVAVSSSMIIPPKQSNWTSEGLCRKECSMKIAGPQALNGNEIRLFASFPHAHTVGTGIWTNILKDGKETREVFRDDNYDFDYQQTYVLSEEVPFKAGEEMMTYCRYNTMARKDATIGGLSTYEEMCLNFIMYYPRVNFTKCVSLDYVVPAAFSQHYAKPVYVDQGIKFNRSATPLPRQYKNWTNVAWNQSMVDTLKRVYAYSGRYAVYPECLGTSGFRYDMSLTNRTVITKKLPPPKDVCVKTVGSASKQGSDLLFLCVLSMLFAYL